MQTSRHWKLVAVWLLCSAALLFFLFGVGKWNLQDSIRARGGEHLLLTLDASNFGNAQGRVNDTQALQGTAREINHSLAGLVVDHWFSPWKRCAVRVQRIDDVVVEPVR